MPRPSRLTPLLICLVLALACSSSSSNDDGDGSGGTEGNEGPEVRGGTIDSAEAAQQFFEAVAPQLIAVLTQAAGQLPGPGLPALKQMPACPNDGLTVNCPDGGSFRFCEMPYIAANGSRNTQISGLCS